MTDEAPKKRRGRKKKVEQELAPAFLQEEKNTGVQKKAGRPKGGESSPVSNVLDPLCKHCGKSGVKITKVMKPILSFAFIDGKKYNTLTRKYVLCKRCEKHSILMVRSNK